MWKIAIDIILKVLAWIGVRPSLAIRIMEDSPESELGNLRFEIENRSPTPTSLNPLIKSTFWYPKGGKYIRGSAYYDVRELDRQLQPFRAKVLSATASDMPCGYGSSWFRSYTFRPTRGPRTTIHVRNAFLEPVGWFCFTYEKLRFRFTGKVKEYGPMSIDDYDELKHSQGPH
jgi:hypothetical protein